MQERLFNAGRSSGVAAAIAGTGRSYGLTLATNLGGPPLAAAIERCVLLTHDPDPPGRVPVQEAADVVAAMTT